MKRSPTRSQFVAKRCSGWIALCDGDRVSGAIRQRISYAIVHPPETPYTLSRQAAGSTAVALKGGKHVSNDNGAEAVREPARGSVPVAVGDDMAGKHDLVYRPFGILTLAFALQHHHHLGEMQWVCVCVCFYSPFSRLRLVVFVLPFCSEAFEPPSQTCAAAAALAIGIGARRYIISRPSISDVRRFCAAIDIIYGFYLNKAEQCQQCNVVCYPPPLVWEF